MRLNKIKKKNKDVLREKRKKEQREKKEKVKYYIYS